MTSDKAQIFAVLISSIIGPIQTNSLPARNTQTLAPHPIYFSVTGKPTKEIIHIEEDDTFYEIYWDGKQLHAPVEVYKKKPILQLTLLLLMIVLSILFWVYLIMWVYHKIKS